MEREQAFIQLYKLINYYYENRDRPADPEFDFFKELRICCETLGLKEQKIIEEFKLHSMYLKEDK